MSVTGRNMIKNKMQYSSQPDVVRLIALPKDFYSFFNTYELQQMRFKDLPLCSHLTSQIIQFNKELQSWKQEIISIPNFIPTYSLYQNLFARLKHISTFILNRNEANSAFQQIALWFSKEKPKIRNKVRQKLPGQMQAATQIQNIEDDDFLQSSRRKRQLKVYEVMARTVHVGMYPPKQDLGNFKRKELVSERKTMSVGRESHVLFKMKKIKMTQTTSTFANSLSTARGLKSIVSVKPFNIVDTPLQVIDKKINEETLETKENVIEMNQEEKQKKVQQDDLLNQNIKEQKNEEDQEQELLSNRSSEACLNKQKYVEDYDKNAEMMAQEKIKDIKMSSLRRILKEKQDKIRDKLEELDIKKNALIWAGRKSQSNTKINRKLQCLLSANRYKQVQYQKNVSASPVQKNMFNIQKNIISLHSKGQQEKIQEIKLQNIVQKYGKYIQLNFKTTPNPQQVKQIRSLSLTSLCRQQKNKPFSALIKEETTKYNENALENVIFIKEKFAKNNISIKTGDICRALTATTAEQYTGKIYPSKKQLFYNPFFPKHLFMAKPKKKKKK